MRSLGSFAPEPPDFLTLRSKWITYEQLADMYKHLASKYPIVSIEDPFAEDDWEAWSYFYKTSDFQIVGYGGQSSSKQSES